jgi:hypothetical protein
VTGLGGVRSDRRSRSAGVAGTGRLRTFWHSDGVGHWLSTFGDSDGLGAVAGSRGNGSSSRVLASDGDSDGYWCWAGGRNGNVGVTGHARSGDDRSRSRRRLRGLLGNGSNWCSSGVNGVDGLVAGRRGRSRRSRSWARLAVASVDGGGKSLGDVAGGQVGGVDRAVSALANRGAARNPSVGSGGDSGGLILGRGWVRHGRRRSGRGRGSLVVASSLARSDGDGGGGGGGNHLSTRCLSNRADGGSRVGGVLSRRGRRYDWRVSGTVGLAVRWRRSVERVASRA